MAKQLHHGVMTDQRDACPYRPSWLDRILIALFLLALVIPAAFLRPDPEAAAAEKRTLAPAPAIPRSIDDLVKFPRAFDLWFADHFGFRQTLIKAHSRISFFVLKTSPSPKIILGAAGEQAIIYRKTDTHWNDTGAWAGVFALTERLRLQFPALPNIQPTNLVFGVVNYRVGDMGNMIGLPGETFEPLVEIRRHPSSVTSTPLTDNPLGDIITTTTNDSLPRAVLFHDSYGHYLKPLLGEYFRWLRFRWSNAGIDRSIIAKSEPELVIHMMAERRIRIGQRYEMAVQQHGNQDRFERSTLTHTRWSPTDGFDGITAPDGLIRTETNDGLKIEGTTRGLRHRPPPHQTGNTHLPVIRIDCTLDKDDELALSWTNHTRTIKGEIKGPVSAGRSTVFLPLLDPDATGPVSVDAVRRSGRITVHSVEIRLIPR
jgi:hypothetical protein